MRTPASKSSCHSFTLLLFRFCLLCTFLCCSSHKLKVSTRKVVVTISKNKIKVNQILSGVREIITQKVMENIRGSLTEYVSEKLGLQHHEIVTGKLLVTGGRGIIGYRVALRLLNSGYPSVRVGFRHPDDECAQELNKKVRYDCPYLSMHMNNGIAYSVSSDLYLSF